MPRWPAAGRGIPVRSLQAITAVSSVIARGPISVIFSPRVRKPGRRAFGANAWIAAPPLAGFSVSPLSSSAINRKRCVELVIRMGACTRKPTRGSMPG